MRRAGLVLAAAVAVALVAPASAGTTKFLGARTVGDATFALNKTKVHPGYFDFQLDNSHGGDPHSLVIRKGTDNTGKLVGRIDTSAGAVEDTADPVRLKRGRYYLYCDVATHEQQGMWVKLKVVG